MSGEGVDLFLLQLPHLTALDAAQSEGQSSPPIWWVPGGSVLPQPVAQWLWESLELGELGWLGWLAGSAGLAGAVSCGGLYLNPCLSGPLLRFSPHRFGSALHKLTSLTFVLVPFVSVFGPLLQSLYCTVLYCTVLYPSPATQSFYCTVLYCTVHRPSFPTTISRLRDQRCSISYSRPVSRHLKKSLSFFPR